MMALEASNMSAAIDIKITKVTFYNLQLCNSLEENISQLAVLVLRYIKVTERRFSLATDLGSTLPMKVSKTRTEIFNWQISLSLLMNLNDATKLKT